MEKVLNNRGQGVLGGVAFFIVLLIIMIIMAPIILRVATSLMDKTSEQFARVDATNNSANLVNYTRNTLTSSFDWAIMLIVIINMLVLLISAFLIDIHPAFVVVYIIAMFTFVLTAPYSMAAAEKIYSMSNFNSGENDVIQYIPMTEFILNNFGLVIVGVIVLSGIVMYAKIKFGTNTGGGIY